MKTDAVTAVAAAELAPPPGGGPLSEEVQARVDELLPEDVAAYDELYESNGVRMVKGPWPRSVAALLVARALTRGSQAAVEYGEVVVRHAPGASSTLTPAGTPFLRPYAVPDGCRDCGLPRPHGQQSSSTGLHGYAAPLDEQRLARMQERRKNREKGQER
ncbi:hypothetical protein ACIRPQ_29315 [Streptomyces sp. NPDC101213]|uniref:hypothetical protein n=1 Tax=Streptomyces sp. NPDC101213 TaxID=3366130 RepID=UPI00382E3A56